MTKYPILRGLTYAGAQLMKILITFICIISIHFAHAQDFTALNSGDLKISQATAKLISAESICPHSGRMACMANGTKLSVRVTLNGCLDNLGGYFTNFEIIDGRGILYFGAINLTNQASFTTRCIRMPTKKVTLVLPFSGEIELVNVNYNGSTKLDF